ncbi:hypothetical protein BSKO_09026 [Bryopsis sp. KO-2023]|nr:hypothetical protein BSKO_09026 [Bryopsis sp. KO-2023]
MRSGAVLFGLLLATRLCLGCELTDSGPKHWVFSCKGASWWRIHEIFSLRTVLTSCPSKLAVESDGYSGKPVRITTCIFGRYKTFQSETGSQLTCLVEASPFRSGIIQVKATSRMGSVGHCEVEAKIYRFSRPRLALFGMGILLILVAKGLASSSHFRIGVGTLFLIFLGVLFLAATLLMRPTRFKTLMTLLVGSICTMLLQFCSTTLYGQEFTIWGLKWDYLVGAYVFISGFLGWMVCYYYDNGQDSRRISLVVHCIQFLGYVMILVSCSDCIAGATLIGSVWGIQRLISMVGPRKGMSMLTSIFSICMCYLPKLEGLKLENRLSVKTGPAAKKKKKNGMDGHPKHRDSGSSMSEDDFSDWEGDGTPKAMEKWCEMCKRGYIKNRTSNRTIAISGLTYQRLIEQGRIPNYREGFI